MITLQSILESDAKLKTMLLTEDYEGALLHVPFHLRTELSTLLLEVKPDFMSSMKVLVNSMFNFADISDVEIPTSVLKIDEKCFDDCLKLEKLIFHSKLKPNILTLCYCAFAGCKSLKQVDFSPVYDVCFGSACMFNCTSLVEITLPEYGMISENAFYRCKKLSKVNYLGSIAEFKSKISLFTDSFKATAVQYVTCLDGIVEVR